MIKDGLKKIDIVLEHVDNKTKETILSLLNIIEAQAEQINELKAQLQNLRDEINRLKGEQGKPDIKPNRKNKQHNDVFSEKERKQSKPRKKRKKNQNIKIDRTEHTYFMQSILHSVYDKRKKNCLAVLEVLKNGAALQYCLNQQAFEIASQLKLCKKYLNPLKKK